MVIGLCGGEVELSGVRTVSLKRFTWVQAMSRVAVGCFGCVFFVWLVGVFALLLFGCGFSTLHHRLLHT